MERVKSNPSVSVIIPAYNRANVIERAVQSVLNQTYQDYEIIIVDDASTDDTLEKLKKFKDKRIVKIRNKKNRGPAGSRNVGIREARGEYIAFLDSDDEWLPQKIEKQAQALEMASSDVGVVYTGTWRIVGDKKFFIPSSKITHKEGNVYRSYLFGKYLVYTSAAVIKRACFYKIGIFDESFPAVAEWDLWIRISKYYEFKYIPEPLVTSYFTPGSMATHYPINFKATRMILEKHFTEIKKSRKALLYFYYKLARIYMGCIFNRIGII